MNTATYACMVMGIAAALCAGAIGEASAQELAKDELYEGFINPPAEAPMPTTVRPRSRFSGSTGAFASIFFVFFVGFGDCSDFLLLLLLDLEAISV